MPSSSLDRYHIIVHQQESPLQLPRICRWHRQQPNVYVQNSSRNHVIVSMNLICKYKCIQSISVFVLCLFCVSTGVRCSQLPCDLVLQTIGSLLYSWFQSFWHQTLIFRLASFKTYKSSLTCRGSAESGGCNECRLRPHQRKTAE